MVKDAAVDQAEEASGQLQGEVSRLDGALQEKSTWVQEQAQLLDGLRRELDVSMTRS